MFVIALIRVYSQLPSSSPPGCLASLLPLSKASTYLPCHGPTTQMSFYPCFLVISHSYLLTPNYSFVILLCPGQTHQLHNCLSVTWARVRRIDLSASHPSPCHYFYKHCVTYQAFLATRRVALCPPGLPHLSLPERIFSLSLLLGGSLASKWRLTV